LFKTNLGRNVVNLPDCAEAASHPLEGRSAAKIGRPTTEVSRNFLLIGMAV
jgi:hypothetical protein